MMTKWKQRITCILMGTVLMVSIGGCSLTKEKEKTGDANPNIEGTPNNTSGTDITSLVNENLLLDVGSDSFYNEKTTIEIVADGDEFSSKGKGVVTNGNTVTITAEGCYRLTGVMNNGQVIVNADNGTDIRLVLDNFEIHNDAGAAIFVANAGNLIVTLKEGTKNLLEQSGTDTESEEVQDAALYSTDDLLINGSGSLTVLGNYSHGIKAKDTLLLAEAIVEVASKEDAINANMDVLVESGSYLLSAGDDGIHTDTNLTIRGGIIDVTKSYEGLEGMQIWIEDGEVSLVASDDAINIASNTAGSGDALNTGRGYYGKGQFGGMETQGTTGFVLVVNGGKTSIHSGGDGIDSNGSILMTGGLLEVFGPTNSANGSLDYAGSCTIQGGVLTMAGASGMAQTPGNNSAQVGVMIYFNGIVSAGTTIYLKDTDGNEIVSMTPTVTYQCAYLSTPDMKQGETYALWKDDTQLCEMTMNAIINSYSSDGTASQGGFGGGMAPGGPGGFGGFDGGMAPGGQGGFGGFDGGMAPGGQGGFDERGQGGSRYK